MASSVENQFHGNNNAEQDQESFSYAMQIVSSSALSMSLYAAIQLELLEIIAKAGPKAKLSPKEIAAQLPCKNPEAPSMLDRILRVLASHGIVSCSVVDEQSNNPQRFYGLTPVSKFFVPNEDGVSFGPLMALNQDRVSLDSWYQLKDAVLEGGVPFDRAHETHVFEYLGKDPRLNQVFNTAMINHTTIIVKKILETYKGFEQLNRLVDVAGGLGVTLSLITSKCPFIKGINFDLPHVIQHAPTYPGVEHVGGDMFESIPKGDAIFMKGVLHNWSDEQCLKLLKNCYNAIPDDGKVIVVDTVLPILPETNAFGRSTSQMDILMMTQLPRGKERNKLELEALATNAGFRGIKYECFVYNVWVMEFFK
ncbi:caffeic acid 3-O-methyltransferase-like [Herrania umbratica]|uniref:Caffeic acid 3-O-methyltransferase-like n=1 Tax=Herrania umbratica TaxID=108875 RepID=A0A6J1BER7_9ROSI|nr:caffeic acid 3-O-methyltransferase-like [Herrania umbratica]